MFGIILNAHRGKKVQKLAKECEATCLALDAQKARETYNRFSEYHKGFTQRENNEWLAWRVAIRPLISYLAPMVLALEGKPNGDRIIRKRMAEKRGEKWQMSKAELSQAAAQLALPLARTRVLAFESCVEAFEQLGAQVLERDLALKTDIELASFQFINVQSAANTHRHLDEANAAEFYHYLYTASYKVGDDDEDSQMRVCALKVCINHLISLYDQGAANSNEKEIEGSGDMCVYQFVFDCLGAAILGELEWQNVHFDPPKLRSLLDTMTQMILALTLWSHWHTAVAFDDQKEIKRLEEVIKGLEKAR